MKFENLFSYSTIELARQLTLYESTIFQKIECFELLDSEWTKKKSTSKNIIDLISWFNKFSSYITYQIVNEPNIKKRAKIIEKSIFLTHDLQKINNYNGVFQIMSGLENSSVYRLKKTWALVPNLSIKKFEEMQDLIDSKGNFILLRNSQRIKNENDQILPYLGLFLTDLIFIDEGNKSTVNNLINFEKRRKVSKIIKNFMEYQKIHFKFRPVKEISDHFLDINQMNDKDLYELSLLNEPKDF
jgi:son of sevenless